MTRAISAIRRRLGALRRADAGTTAVEFGLIVGIVLTVSVAVIEFSLVVLDYARAAEAARAASRAAVMLPPVGNLENLAAGDVVCSFAGGATACDGAIVENPDTFDAIVTAMRDVLPMIAADNVEVRYVSSGIGSFDSGGIKPYVTIRLTGLQRPYQLLHAVLGTAATLTLPDFVTTQIGNSYVPG